MRTLTAVPMYPVTTLTCVIGAFTIQKLQIVITKPLSAPTESRESKVTSRHNFCCTHIAMFDMHVMSVAVHIYLI